MAVPGECVEGFQSGAFLRVQTKQAMLATGDFELSTPAEASCNESSKKILIQRKRKEEEDDEVQLLTRPNPLLLEFNESRFSDVCLVGFGKSLKLHKILLVQSPYLNSKIVQDGADLIFVELSDWPVKTGAGMEVIWKF